MRRLVSWMRVVLPPTWVVVAFLLVCPGIKLIGLASGTTGDPSLRAVAFWSLALSCIVYGIYRGVSFHPLFHPDYHDWLKATPWTSRQQLPMGPIHLAAQDLVVFLVVLLYNEIPPAAPCYHLHTSPPIVYSVPVLLFLCFMVPYLICQIVSLDYTGPFRLAYALIFGLGFVPLFLGHELVQVGIVILLYVLACLGIRYALARFPWEEKAVEAFRRAYRVITAGRKSEGARDEAGWPFECLSQEIRLPQPSVERGIYVSFLIGWWLLVLTMLPGGMKKSHFLFLAYLFVVCTAPYFRALLYCFNRWPPIGILGRIFTLRWIIPGYDKVLIAPLCAWIVGVRLPFLLRQWGLGYFSLPISLTVVFLILLLAPPSLKSWRLTGCHRIMGPKASSSKTDSIQQI